MSIQKTFSNYLSSYTSSKEIIHKFQIKTGLIKNYNNSNIKDNIIITIIINNSNNNNNNNINNNINNNNNNNNS